MRYKSVSVGKREILHTFLNSALLIFFANPMAATALKRPAIAPKNRDSIAITTINEPIRAFP